MARKSFTSKKLAQITVFGLLIGGVLAPGGTAQAGSEIYRVSVSFSGVPGSNFRALLTSTIQKPKLCQNSGWSGSLPVGLNLPSTTSPIGEITGVSDISSAVTGNATYMCYKGAIADNHTYQWVYNISFDFSPPATTTTTTTTTTAPTTTTTTRPTTATATTTTVAKRPEVSPGLATGAMYAPVSLTKTKVTWSTTTSTVEYKVFLNGVLECISTTSTCDIPKLSGPSDSVQIASVGTNGTSSELTSAKYFAKWLPAGVLYFDPMMSNLDSNSEGTLGEIVELLRKHGFSQIRLTGHTDGDGDRDDNLELSRERVASSSQWLNSRLSSSSRIFEKYLGRSSPTRPNISVENKKLNRRVEIEVK